MQSNEIRTRFLEFFKKRDHAVIPSASLVPQNDPSVLFTTAGMQPLVPYLLGQKHPQGNRLVGVQKCVRTQDIEEVGDKTHDTFFEMLGNWSLGDPESLDGVGEGYFKEKAIEFSYEFLTDPREGLGLDPNRLYITVFAGNADAPRDDESARMWKRVGIPSKRIYYLEDNWWSPGEGGPCGPDSEMFYDVTKKGLGDLSHEEFVKADERQDVVEIWNDVFMEYEKEQGVVVRKLKVKNVDTGAGLERLAMVMQGKDNLFSTDLFAPLMEGIAGDAKRRDTQLERIIADHVRTAVFIIGDGVVPSNTDRGYILRRLIRRASRYANSLEMGKGLPLLVDIVIDGYKDTYPELLLNKEMIMQEIHNEEEKFKVTLEKGLRELEKKHAGHIISGKDAFDLYQTFGFPVEMTEEIARERGVGVDVEGFRDEFKKHQEISRSGSGQKFKGGLADESEQTIMLHTTTHLLLAGLRKYLGEHVHQAGSNITSERTRFDFTHPEKVDKETLTKVEEYVNEALGKGCVVTTENMSKEEAKKGGVEGSFWERYPDTVTVYKIMSPDGELYSSELCGGPHVKKTNIIKGVFKIQKEEAVSAGVRRIKATLEEV